MLTRDERILNRSCSAIIVDPTSAFHDWLDSAVGGERFQPSAAERDIPEERSVWVVPEVASFSSEEVFWDFIESAKPAMLAVELHRVLSDASQYPDEMNSQTFDRFFQVSLRDEVGDLTQIGVVRG